MEPSFVYLRNEIGNMILVAGGEVMLVGENSLDSGDAAEVAWMRTSQSGLRISDTFDEIKQFAFHAFTIMDSDGDGFITREELSEALTDNALSWRERSFVSFLLRRLDDIKAAYDEEWDPDNEGISRVDIQEYFKNLSKNSNLS